MTKHTWYVCSGGHEYPGNCMFCDGGLGSCTVCKGIEGTLPTECPGIPMTEDQQEQVYKGPLDFRNGKWCPKKSEENS